jgi:hypothetical protein
MNEPRDLARVDAPRRIEQARTAIRSFREQLALAGGGFTVAGLAGYAAGLAEAVPLAAAGLAGLTLLYLFPVTDAQRRARAVLSEWETMRSAALVPGVAADDERIAAAEAMVGRIVEYMGSEPQSALAARALLRVLHDSLEDLAAAALLRSADSGAGESPSRLSGKADELMGQINDRMSRSVEIIADIYSAVLAHDALALHKVLQSAEEELVHLRAEEEVEALLDGTPPRRVE